MAVIGRPAGARRKTTDTALREADRKYRLLFEHSQALNLLVGWDARVMDMNSTLGYSKAEALGRKVTDFVSPESRGVLLEFLKNLPDARPQRSADTGFEADFLARDGTIRTFLFSSGSPGRIHRPGGRPGLLFTGIDVTAARLTRDRICQQERELLQSAKLIAGIAHEINNPNHFIRLSAQSLQGFWRDIDPALAEMEKQGKSLKLSGIPYSSAREMLMEMLDGLEEGSRRIERLILGLKEYAFLDRDSLHQTIEVREVIREAELVTGSLIRGSTDSYSCRIDADLPPIRGNLRQIRQVLVNLITNACQALSSRSQSISVTAGYEADRGEVVLAVRDEGIGIPDEQLDRITDPFFTTRRDSGSSGLGLALSERIVRNHGGTLCFDSGAGAGTTVRVRLIAERS